MFALDTPDTTLDAYWATAAQILAVLSLAVVIEARGLQRQWRGMPAWIQFIQGAMWCFILGSAAFLLPFALEASRPDRSQPDWMPELTQRVIFYSATVLVLSPAFIFLLTGSAESYYAVKGLAPRVRWRAWRQSRRSRRLLKQDEQQTRETQQLVEGATAVRERIEGVQQEMREKVETGLTVMRERDLSPEQADQMMSWIEWHIIRDFEGSVHLQRGNQLVAQAHQFLQEAPSRRAEIAALVAETEDSRRQLGSTLRDMRKAQAALFRSYFTPPEPGAGASPKA